MTATEQAAILSYFARGKQVTKCPPMAAFGAVRTTVALVSVFGRVAPRYVH